MLPLQKMCEDQPLPVQIQIIRTAVGRELKSAARKSRLQNQMHLRIMAERLIMPYTFYDIFYCFLIYNISSAKCHIYSESFAYQTFQNLCLHLAHKLNMDFAQFFIPNDPKHRIFFLDLTHIAEHGVCIHLIRKINLIIQNWF